MKTNMTKSMVLGFSASVFGASLLLASPAARAQQGGIAERVGDRLDNAGRNIRSGVQNAFQKTQTAVHDQEIVTRVYSRLHWEKALVGSALEIEVRDGGITVLRGAVPNAAAKQRALVLARDTVDVLQVVDELTIIPPSRVVPGTTKVTTVETTETTKTIVTPR